MLTTSKQHHLRNFSDETVIFFLKFRYDNSGLKIIYLPNLLSEVLIFYIDSCLIARG